jgi:hypothetical protein
VVYADPTVTISSSFNPSDVFYDVTFTSTPAGGSGSYSYSWGGGTVSGSSRNLTWQFSSAGNFTVTLTLTDSAGYQVSASLTQRVNALPVVSLTSSSNPSVAGHKVYFNCSVEYGTGPFTYQFYMSIVNANLATETYHYTISNTAGSYYNSSYIYFNYSQPLSGISFPSLNFKISVSNLTRAGLGGQADTFTVINQNFTSYSLTQGTTYSLTGWKNVTSQSISIRFQTSEYVIPAISFVYSPSEYSSVSASTTISSTATVSGGIVLTSMVLLINGVESASQAGSGTSSISMTYSLSSWFSTHLVLPIAVTWQASSAQGTDHITVDYQTNILPPPHSVSVLSSNTSTHTFPITLTGVPSGTGYYQQLLNIPNPSQYSINPIGSNVEFSASNGTPEYAWIQSVNTTTLAVWVKNFNGSATINMEVFPEFENLFSANGYLGIAPQYSTPYASNDNGIKVFGKTNYTNFYNLSETNNFLNMAAVTSSYSFSNGIIFPKGISSTNVNPNTIASNVQYKYGDYFGFSLLANISTVSYFRAGYGFSNNANNSYWLSAENPAVLAMYNLNFPHYGSISYPNMTYVNGYVAETTVGVPFLNFNGVSVTSGIAITAVNHRAFIQLNAGYASFRYMFVASETGSMPTSAIGSGNVFMANASSSHVSSETGTPVGYGGNATYQLYSYTIPVSPSSDYLTVIYNSTSYFDPRSVTPGTYYVYPQLHAVTFFNLSGYTSVSLSLDEISPEIGQPVSLVIQPEQDNNSVIIDNSHLVVYYSLYGFKSVLQTSSYGLNVILPYGSTASFFLYNKWNQLVGSTSNVSIDSLSPIINLPVDTATLSFDFLNASQESISLTSNGITVSGFFGSAQVAIGYSYVWLTSVYDSFTGRNVNYTGSVVITQSQQILMVSTNASASSFTVYVDSYGPSQQGQLGAPNEPLVDLTIDGHVQTPGQTYIAFIGSTYQVRVTDVLGQFLYESNVTVRTTTLNFYANITVPSWQWSIQNEEQVPSSSPLAIEQVSIKDSAGHTYNFTNDINQQSVIYLRQGNYTVSAKDNATFMTNISLTQNENYVIFSQNLLTYAEFVTLMGSILNNTQGLSIQTVSSESLVMPSQLLSFEFEVFYANSTQLDHSALSSLTFLTQITNSSGVSNVPHSFVISGRYVFLNFSAPSSAGQYTASINAFRGSIGGHVSYFFTVESIITQSKGMNMTGAGPSGSIDVNVSYNFTLLVYYSNGSLMNHKDTVSVFNNLTFEIFNGVDPAQSIQKLNAYSGEITFEALFNRTGTYSIVASSTADLNGKDYAHAIIPVSVINPTAIYAVTLTGSKSILVDVTMSYVALITSTEAMNISTKEMSGFTNGSTLQVMTGGHVVATLNASTHVNSTIYFAVNLTTPGNYTFIYQTAYRGTVLTSILFVRVFSSQPTSHNLIGTLTGPMDVERNATAVYTLDMLIESNGQTVIPTEQQTVWLTANTTYQVALNGAIIATGHAAYFAPGAITITLSFANLSASYSVIVTVGNTTLIGSHIWFRGSVSPISVLPYNPSNPPNPLVQLATGVGAQIFYLVVAIVGVIGIVYRWLTRRKRELVDSIDNAGIGIEGQAILKVLNHKMNPSAAVPPTALEQQIYDAIEQKVVDKLVFDLTSGSVRLKAVKPRFHWPKISSGGKK